MVLIIFPCALYADHLSDALTDQVSLLRNLESLLETRSNHLQSTINLLGDLQITTNRIQQLVLDCVFFVVAVICVCVGKVEIYMFLFVCA